MRCVGKKTAWISKYRANNKTECTVKILSCQVVLLNTYNTGSLLRMQIKKIKIIKTKR